MNWNVFKKVASGKKRKNLRAYEEAFVSRHQEETVHQIFENETKKKMCNISKISDEGVDERNRLKASLEWVKWRYPQIQKVEVEGSLSLESRLSEALERAEGVTKDTK